MLDMGIQTGQSNPNWYDVMRPSQLPAYENQYGADGNFYASVRQTRLGFKTATPIGDDELKIIFEFELFGTGPDAVQRPSACGMPTANINSLARGNTGVSLWTRIYFLIR